MIANNKIIHITRAISLIHFFNKLIKNTTPNSANIRLDAKCLTF